jgi:hypothetical protein
MSEQIVDGTQINAAFQFLSFSAPKPNPTGGKVVNMFDSRFKESLIISTPLILTWGAQEGKEQGTDKLTGKWTMSLQFPSEEYKTDDQMEFLQSMKNLELYVKQSALTNSKLWFGKEIKSMDIIEEKFNPMVKYPKVSKGSAEFDYSRPPTMTVKIPKWKSGWKSEIYDEDGEPVYIPESLTNEQVKELKTQPELDEAISLLNDGHSPVEYLPKQTRVICLLQCGGLWFVNGKVSITWNLQQAVVKKPKQSTKGICFIRPRATEREALKSMPHPEEPEQYSEEIVSTTLVDDSDDENDTKPSANVDPEPEPTLEQVVKSEHVVEPVLENKKSTGRKSKK